MTENVVLFVLAKSTTPTPVRSLNDIVLQ